MTTTDSALVSSRGDRGEGLVTRDRDSLLRLLEDIDRTGWAGQAGTALLIYIRQTIVRSLAIELGLRGAAATQAEATAWEEVWLALIQPSLRSAESPWGVVWGAARHALLTEVVCARFATSPRKAWEQAAVERLAGGSPTGGLAELRPDDEPAIWADRDPTGQQPTDVVSSAISALITVGWPARQASAIVEDVMGDTPTTRGTRWTTRPHGWTTFGWRSMAARLDLPAWQARRLVLVLRGTADSPGLLPRLIMGGGRVPADLDLRPALLSTRYRSRRSPSLPALAEAEATTREPLAS
ncbi:MAG TPA: hypothetical protein VGK17_06850 [Propionicimonas sp.]